MRSVSAATTVGRSWWRGPGRFVVAALVVVGALAGLAVWLSGKDTFTTNVSMVVLGNDCSSNGYSDVNQVVVRNPAGEEVAFSDLLIDDEGVGHCAYKGTIEIDDGSSYFVVGSRRESRAGLRMTRAETKDGIELSIGECVDESGLDLDPDVLADCLAYLLPGSEES